MGNGRSGQELGFSKGFKRVGIVIVYQYAAAGWRKGVRQRLTIVTEPIRNNFEIF